MCKKFAINKNQNKFSQKKQLQNLLFKFLSYQKSSLTKVRRHSGANSRVKKKVTNSKPTKDSQQIRQKQ